MVEHPYRFREIGVGHYPMGTVELTASDRARLPETMGLRDPKPLGKLVYVHIPFCQSICPFCPYPKAYNQPELRGEYLKSLYAEMELYGRQPHIAASPVEAVYFGGGTPTVLSEEEITGLFAALHRFLPLDQVEEITFEGNPASFDAAKAKLLHSLGVNRISLGVQTFDDCLATAIGLIHNREQSLAALAAVRDAGIPNLSIDLMYNLPGQTPEGFRRDLTEAVELGVDHLTLFPLKVIPGFGLFKRIQSGELPPCGGIEEEQELYRIALEVLEQAGYGVETTYDWAKPGMHHVYSRKHFGERKELLALGMGVFGEVHGYAYQNVKSIPEYNRLLAEGVLPVEKGYAVQEEDRPNQYLAMGLRQTRIDRGDFKRAFGRYPEELFSERFDRYQAQGLVTISQTEISLKRDLGLFWGNNVCKDFCEESFKAAFPK